MQVSGTTAMITGGASGLGAATARRLHRHGANVVLADINEEMGQAMVGELRERAAYFRTDIAVTAQLQAMMDFTVDRFGGLHVLVNCAAIFPAARTLSRSGPHDIDRFKQVIAVNLVGTFDAVRLAAERMARNEPNESGERGVIINTGSIAASEPVIGNVAYAASKAGVVGLTLALARDLASYGIRACTIAPGAIDTPAARCLTEEMKASVRAQLVFPKRFGLPDEYAMLVEQIVENPMLNGETIRLDGALRLAPQ